MYFLIFCEPAYNTSEQTNPWGNLFPLSFHSEICIWASCLKVWGRELYSHKICIHNIFKLEIKPIKLSKLLIRLKAERATSKNQHATFFLYSYCVFLKDCTSLAELIKVWLDFPLQILKIAQNYLEAAFRDTFLNKNTIQHFVSFVLLELQFTICWSDTGSLFYHHLLYIFVHCLAFLCTLLLSALVRITICKHQDNPWSLGLTETLHSAFPSCYFALSSGRFSIDFQFSLIFKSVSALYIFPPTNCANQRNALIATLTFSYFHATPFLYIPLQRTPKRCSTDNTIKLPNSMCHACR